MEEEDKKGGENKKDEKKVINLTRDIQNTCLKLKWKIDII